jgi:hypothetical protein
MVLQLQQSTRIIHASICLRSVETHPLHRMSFLFFVQNPSWKIYK